MPKIVQDPGILAGAQAGIEVLLLLKGQEVVLTPNKGIKVAKAGGGHDFVAPEDRLPQVFSLSKTTAFDGIELSPNDEGTNRKRSYVLTGRFDAEIGIGDTWEDDEAEYTVNTVDSTSGYKTVAGVTGWLKQVP